MTDSSPVPRTRALPITAAALLDAALVVVFAGLGRNSHDRAATIAGLWETAWPFLAGLAIAWCVALVWRAPIAVVRSGLPVWIGTVALGLLLRAIFTDGGAALPFVLVATGMLGVLLVGWRLIAVLTTAISRRRHT